MPDYLDDLVRSANGATAEARPPLPEGGPQASAEPPGAASARAASQAAGETVVREEQRQEALEVPPEIRTEERAVGAAGGGVAGGSMGGLDEPAGQAVGPVEGRMMAVMPEERGPDELGALVGVISGIALMGLPAGRPVTQAVGSKI